MSCRAVCLLLLVQVALPAAEPTGRLANLSVRAAVSSTTDGALTAGFVVAGPGSKSVLVRAVGAFAFSRGSADAALVRVLPPGSYTARVMPAREGLPSGVALIEVYDADPTAPARLLNLSARARA